MLTRIHYNLFHSQQEQRAKEEFEKSQQVVASEPLQIAFPRVHYASVFAHVNDRAINITFAIVVMINMMLLFCNV
jgi:hypothetical protein